MRLSEPVCDGHFQKFVTIFGLFDTRLQLDEFAAGWFDIQCHSIPLVYPFVFVFKLDYLGGTCQSIFGLDAQDTLCQ